MITGRSPSPVVLVVKDDEISFYDGGHLWGKDTFETEEILSREMPWGIGVSCIGPAGEKQVPLAGILHDGVHARAAGRGGLGAVMGSKNLKAIVAKGKRLPTIADRKALNELIIESNNRMKEKGAGMRFTVPPADGERREVRRPAHQELEAGILARGPRPYRAALARTFTGITAASLAPSVAAGSDLDGLKMGGPEYESLACWAARAL